MAKRVIGVTNAQTAETSFPAVFVDGSNFLAAGATRTLATTDHMATVKLDTATGSTVTLPASTGAGIKYKFVVSVLATTANHIVKVANSSDVMQGVLAFENTTGGVVMGFAANASADTITLNRTTTGSVSKGEWFEIQDFALNVWQVNGILTSAGSPANPFTSAV